MRNLRCRPISFVQRWVTNHRNLIPCRFSRETKCPRNSGSSQSHTKCGCKVSLHARRAHFAAGVIAFRRYVGMRCPSEARVSRDGRWFFIIKNPGKFLSTRLSKTRDADLISVWQRSFKEHYWSGNFQLSSKNQYSPYMFRNRERLTQEDILLNKLEARMRQDDPGRNYSQNDSEFRSKSPTYGESGGYGPYAPPVSSDDEPWDW